MVVLPSRGQGPVSLMAPSRDPMAEVPQVPKDIKILKIVKERREKERIEKDKEIRMIGGEKSRSKIGTGIIRNK